MFAAIYIPDFSVEAVVRVRPELRDHALIVIDGVPPLAYVVGLNDRAREVGIRLGMTRMQAEAFSTSINGDQQNAGTAALSHGNGIGARKPAQKEEGDPRFRLVRDPIHMHNAQEHAWLSKQKRTSRAAANICVSLAQRSPQQEAAAHAALLDAAYAFSPRVEDTAPDTVVLDIAGLDRLFGAPPKITREIARRVSEVGLEAQVAIASNPDNAVHAARGFSGTTVIVGGTEAVRLGSLPLDVLFATEINCRHTDARNGPPKKKKPQEREFADRLTRMHETLDRWGIRNFRALASLPPVSLSERLGTEGVRLQKLANGETRRELVLTEPVLEFEEVLELEYPVELIEPLAFLLGRMLEQLCARLSARALSTNELHLRLELEHCAGDEMTVGTDELCAAPRYVERKLSLPVAMNDPRLFLKLMHLELNGNPPGAPVTKIWVSAEPSRPRVAQAGLFMPLSPEPEKLELTLARIHRVLGAGPPAAESGAAPELRAGSAELLDTHQPDAFKMVRFKPQPAEGRRDSSQGSAAANDERQTAVSLTTALRVLRPALAANVVVRDARPARLVCNPIGAKENELRDNVLWAAGPWRTSGNWWVFAEDVTDTGESTPHAWHREQWDVAVSVLKSNGKQQLERHVALYRLSHDLLSQEWFVEGSYD